MLHNKLTKADEKLLRGYCEALPKQQGVNHFRRLKNAWLNFGQSGIKDYLTKIKNKYFA